MSVLKAWAKQMMEVWAACISSGCLWVKLTKSASCTIVVFLCMHVCKILGDALIRGQRLLGKLQNACMHWKGKNFDAQAPCSLCLHPSIEHALSKCRTLACSDGSLDAQGIMRSENQHGTTLNWTASPEGLSNKVPAMRHHSLAVYPCVINEACRAGRR